MNLVFMFSIKRDGGCGWDLWSLEILWPSLASWTSFRIIVTRLAWSVFSYKCTMSASAASLRVWRAWLCQCGELPFSEWRLKDCSLV